MRTSASRRQRGMPETRGVRYGRETWNPRERMHLAEGQGGKRMGGRTTEQRTADSSSPGSTDRPRGSRRGRTGARLSVKQAPLLLLVLLFESTDTAGLVISRKDGLVGRTGAKRANGWVAARDAGAKTTKTRGQGERIFSSIARRLIRPIEWLR